jgi:hypothetical protein
MMGGCMVPMRMTAPPVMMPDWSSRLSSRRACRWRCGRRWRHSGLGHENCCYGKQAEQEDLFHGIPRGRMDRLRIEP